MPVTKASGDNRKPLPFISLSPASNSQEEGFQSIRVRAALRSGFFKKKETKKYQRNAGASRLRTRQGQGPREGCEYLGRRLAARPAAQGPEVRPVRLSLPLETECGQGRGRAAPSAAWVDRGSCWERTKNRGNTACSAPTPAWSVSDSSARGGPSGCGQLLGGGLPQTAWLEPSPALAAFVSAASVRHWQISFFQITPSLVFFFVSGHPRAQNEKP